MSNKALMIIFAVCCASLVIISEIAHKEFYRETMVGDKRFLILYKQWFGMCEEVDRFELAYPAKTELNLDIDCEMLSEYAEEVGEALVDKGVVNTSDLVSFGRQLKYYWTKTKRGRM